MAGKADTEGEGAGLEAFGARDLSVYVPELNGDLHFFVFETKCGSASMSDCVAPSLGLERAPPLGRYIEDLITFLSRHWATAHQKNGGILLNYKYNLFPEAGSATVCNRLSYTVPTGNFLRQKMKL